MLLATLIVGLSAAWPGPSQPAVADAGDGTLTVEVFRTFTESAVYDSANDVPQAGLVVTVTDPAGNVVSGTSDVNGQFVLPASASLVGGKYRVEVSIPPPLSSYLDPAFAQLGGGYSSFVNFVDLSGGAAALVRTAVWNPADYTQVDPPLAIPVHSGAQNTETRALISWDSSARGFAIPENTVETQADVGTVYGTAYDRLGDRLFSAAFAKRHTQYGPGGNGAIYVAPASGGAATLFATVPNTGTTAHTAPQNQDAAFFDAPGKESIGDIELSEDGQTLYVVNMFEKSLVSFDANTGALLATVPIPDPGCVGGAWRPMGIGIHDGLVYAGGVCDASTSQLRADLSATVYEYDGAVFTPIVNHSLAYDRGATSDAPFDKSLHWNPWVSSFNLADYDLSSSGITRPTPELSDIAFDRDGSIILGFRDRTGDQNGFLTLSPDGLSLIQTVVGGDTVMVCRGAGGAYNWEGEGGCPNNYDPTYTGNQFPAVSEYFVGETVLGLHREPTMGTVATLLRTDDVVTSSFDPMHGAYTSGVQYLSLADGTGQYQQGLRGGNRGAELLNAAVGNFGKGNGLGDLAVLADPAPIQIGNYVWFDTDHDGIQDADEIPIEGIQVNLVRNGIVIGTRTTDTRGEYYFSSLDADLGGQFQPLGGDYEIEFVKPTTGTITVPGLGPVQWTQIKFTQQTPGFPTIDSNPDPATGRTLYTAGAPGQDDHTLDAGFTTFIPGYEHSKASDPVGGTTVVAGEAITYTVTGTNTGETILDPVVITDDMSNVLNNATITVGPVVTVYNADNSVASTTPIALVGTTLSWTGVLQVGQRVEIVYTVTIDSDVAAGVIVSNNMSSSATPPGEPPIVPPPVTISHPVPGYTHSKTSNPVGGTTVVAGDAITYTVTGRNTGATVLDPVTVTDDMANVLNNATLNADPVVTIYNADNSVASTTTITVPATTLSWTGVLQIGQRVEITYTVTIDADVAAGVIVSNNMSSSATPPGEPPITPPPVTISHPVPGYTHSKTSDPVGGTTVVAGDTITYTVTGTNTGATVLDPVTITDDMANVLNNATLNAGPVVTIYNADNSVASTTTIALVGTTLSWTGVLQVGQRVEIVYTVTIDADVAAGVIVSNQMSSSATPPGEPPITPPPVTISHPVPGYEHSKTSDPVGGTTVVAGDTITYTVTGTNTGATVLDPVTITDDMANVLNNATLDADPVVTIYNADNSVASTTTIALVGTTLSWTGVLQVGQRVEIVYTVTIDADVAAGVIVSNNMSSSATPPGEPPITPPPVTISHPVPGYEHSKTSDPIGGTTVVAGDAITYTVTGRNTGATLLDPVTVTDDMSNVLNNATLDADPVVTIYNADNSIASTTTIAVVGTTLSWTGVLQVGQRVEIVYTVTVDADVTAGVIVNNNMSSSATPPGEPPIVPPPVTISHPVPGYEHSKTSDPVGGTTVVAGDAITYTVTGRNTGATLLDPVTVTDDMSNVLNNATVTAGPTARVFNADNSEVIGVPPATLVGTTLSWSGVLQVGQRVEIVYIVTIDADVAAGVIVSNNMSSTGTPPGEPPITPPPVTIDHPTPGFALTKTSNPAPGSAVKGGDSITYTVIGRNTGATVLDPVVITDDLAAVLNNATLIAGPTASSGPAPTITGTTMEWAGVLQPGESVTLQYTVRLNDDVAAGVIVRNVANGTATPPGEPPIIPPPTTTEHPVPGFELSKSSSPATGSTVNPGDVITFTVTGTNTGASVLDPVVITDDMSNVLNNATLVSGPTASSGPTPTLNGSTIQWAGALAVGASVTITYAVTMNPNVSGTILQNTVRATATPPGVPPITPPPAATTHDISIPVVPPTTPPTPPTMPPPPESLPQTGAGHISTLLNLTMLFLGAGALIVLGARRRRRADV